MKRSFGVNISVGTKRRCVRKLFIDLTRDEDTPVEFVEESFVDMPLVDMSEDGDVENCQCIDDSETIIDSDIMEQTIG